MGIVLSVSTLCSTSGPDFLRLRCERVTLGCSSRDTWLWSRSQTPQWIAPAVPYFWRSRLSLIAAFIYENLKDISPFFVWGAAWFYL